MFKIYKLPFLYLCLISLGLFLSTLSYQSVEPILITVIIGNIFLVFLILFVKNRQELIFSFLSFSIFIFLSGLASIFNNIFKSINNDEAFFFLSSIGNRQYLDSVITNYDGYGAVAVWAFFYNLFYELGFSKIPHIGITINIVIMTFSGMLIYKTAEKIYKNDYQRINRLFFLYPLNGLILIFAITHLRDAFSFFLISLLTFSWINFITDKKLNDLFFLIIFNIFSFYSFAYIRPEFLLIPFALILSFLASIFFVNKDKNLFYFRGIKSIAIIFLLSSLTILWKLDFFYIINQAYEGYRLLNESSNSSSSLGTILIVDAILPIRLILGSFYLFIFPIPFWAELDYQSLYHLLKFFNLFYFYFFIPLIILSFYYFIKLNSFKTLTNYFLLFSIIGFTVSVALTSLETRHLGQFLPFFILFSLIPPLKNKIEFFNYSKIFLIFISLILLIHILWIFLKI